MSVLSIIIYPLPIYLFVLYNAQPMSHIAHSTAQKEKFLFLFSFSFSTAKSENAFFLQKKCLFAQNYCLFFPGLTKRATLRV